MPQYVMWLVSCLNSENVGYFQITVMLMVITIIITKLEISFVMPCSELYIC